MNAGLFWSLVVALTGLLLTSLSLHLRVSHLERGMKAGRKQVRR